MATSIGISIFAGQIKSLIIKEEKQTTYPCSVMHCGQSNA